MTNILLYIIAGLSIANILATILKKNTNTEASRFKNLERSVIRFENSLSKIDSSFKDGMQRNRTENNENSRMNRDELDKSLKSFESNFGKNIEKLNTLLNQKFDEFAHTQRQLQQSSTENIRDIRTTIEKQLGMIRNDNNKKLEEVRATVDEKLQKTLNIRLTQSFETVGKQLQAVQEGLGEMKNLASDVGGLKKVLSNVKLRGGLGEVQLEMLLEQILAPDQYEKSVKTKIGSSDPVDFAIKLPGRDNEGSTVWLPIDAKFPKNIYEKVVEACDSGDRDRIDESQKKLDNTIKKMAKDISSKYLDPPNTTDFGILFLPFEAIYAEVVRKVSLLEELHREHKIIITGPTTLAAILNSLQMGFRTLAIEKRSSEVWKVLGAVKKEFENFEGMMQKAQKNIQDGLNKLDTVMGVRTRAIQRQLKDVETLNATETRKILPDFTINPEDD